jgi:tRNA pseudouridine38-40 synthase
MQRYFVQLAYNGKKYHGWQIQPNALSVQEELQKALTVITGADVQVVGAGRTDTGVHASFFVAHFDLDAPYADIQKLCFQLNSFLANDIRIDTIFAVPDCLHARFSAISRTYKYYITQRKEPFLNDFTSFVPQPVDVDVMNKAAKLLCTYSDFTSFSKLHSDVKTNICKLDEAYWEYDHRGLLVFTIRADRFLRNMVRAIVGTLVEIGRGKLSIHDIEKIIEAKNRGKAGASARACGLFLCGIDYPLIDNAPLPFVYHNSVI